MTGPRYVLLSGGATVVVGGLAANPAARHGFVPDAWTGTSCVACFGWVSDPQHLFHSVPSGRLPSRPRRVQGVSP